MAAPPLDRCANNGCEAQYRRYGEGELFVFVVDDPEAWGLAANVKQKVVWLCDSCCRECYVRLDRRRYTAQVVRRRGRAQRAA